MTSNHIDAVVDEKLARLVLSRPDHAVRRSDTIRDRLPVRHTRIRSTTLLAFVEINSAHLSLSPAGKTPGTLQPHRTRLLDPDEATGQPPANEHHRTCLRKAPNYASARRLRLIRSPLQPLSDKHTNQIRAGSHLTSGRLIDPLNQVPRQAHNPHIIHASSVPHHVYLVRGKSENNGGREEVPNG